MLSYFRPHTNQPAAVAIGAVNIVCITVTCTISFCPTSIYKQVVVTHTQYIYVNILSHRGDIQNNFVYTIVVLF